jgi:Lysyl oxidase
MDCQWLDITGLAPGEYSLGIQVNPERRLNEVDFTNNALDVAVTLPSFNPVEPCIEAFEDSLSGAASQDCGWSMTSPVEGVPCEPGALVELTCPGCLGDPMTRICEGTIPCSAGAALASAFETVESDGQLGGACSPEASSCTYVDLFCPYAAFTCPPSGVYSWLVAPQSDLGLAICDLRASE